MFGLPGIHNHPFHPADRRCVGGFFWLRPHLAIAPVQQGFRGGKPCAGRHLGVVHDFGDHRDRGGAVGTGQFRDVRGDVGVVGFHGDS
jgi:hypothetical protein